MKKTVLGILALVAAGGAVLLGPRSARNHKPEVQEVSVTAQIPVTAVPSAETPSSAPFQVRFVPAGLGKLEEPLSVDLVVETQPKGGPPELSGETALEFLLRLPVGVELRSEGWEPVDLPAEEKEDPTGPWTLFERKAPVSIPTEASGELARERLKLAVVERGVNWIVTTRARIVQGSQSWQAFGVVFATVSAEGEVEFHSAPRSSQTEQRAQAN